MSGTIGGKNIKKGTKKIISISLLLLFIPVMLPSVNAAGNTKMGVTVVSQDITIGDTFTATVWLDGDEAIDAFKITLMEWNNQTLNGNSVSSGWWDWLWDPGTINNAAGTLTNVQAGSQTQTTDNETACTISYTSKDVGYSYLNLTTVEASSGGPTVPCATFNTSLIIHPDRGTFSASAYSPYQINLTFTHNASNCNMIIRGSKTGYPSSPQAGDEIYNSSGTNYAHTGLDGGDTWYYRTWTYNETYGLFSVNYRQQSATTPVTKMGIIASHATVSTNITVTVWLDCAEDIDGFKINLSEWVAGKINLTAVNSGWWDWLWDPGTINNSNGTLMDVQAGSSTPTSTNQTAYTFNVTANTVSVCPVNLTDVQLSAGGPTADCIAYDSTVTVHPGSCMISADAYNATQINLSFSKGEAADWTVIRGSTTSYPSSPTSGISVYSGDAALYSHSNLSAGVTWYYSAWAYNTSEGIYSIDSINSTNRTITPNPPIIGDPTPSNASQWQDLGFIWLVYISDADGDPLDWTIECSNGNSSNGIGEANGTKYLTVSLLNYSIEYTVWVNASDGINTTRRWFTFSTISNVTDLGGAKIISISLPNDATVENNNINVLIELISPSTFQPDPGKALDILVYASYINGSIIVNGENPTEIGNGLYVHSISISTIGDYVAWAVVTYDSDQYMDAALFKVKWNVYNNVSRLYERLSDSIALGSSERQNNTRMTIYRINQLEFKLDDIDLTVEEQSLLDSLAETALQGIFEAIIFILVLIVVFTVGAAFFGERRTKRLVRSLHPTTAAEKIVFGSEPVFTENRRHINQNRRSQSPRNVRFY